MTALTTMASHSQACGLDGADDQPAAKDSAVDLELARRAQAGEEEAFAELVNRNRRAVYRAAYAALGSAADADDVTQEAFIAAFRNLRGFRGDASFRTWVLAIAWRKALDRRRSVVRWLRRMASRTRSDDASERIDGSASPEPSQEDALASGELHRTLKRLIATLPTKLRDVLLLAGSGEYSYEQIGRMLGIPVGTVKWRVSEARRILKAKLAALGYHI